jgi:hypothetical protein
MKINEALTKLFEAGLVAESNNSNTRILGGIEKTAESGFNVYSEPFNIYCDGNDWVLAVSGPGQFDTVEQMKTLDAAVTRVCKIYQNKGLL